MQIKVVQRNSGEIWNWQIGHEWHRLWSGKLVKPPSRWDISNNFNCNRRNCIYYNIHMLYIQITQIDNHRFKNKTYFETSWNHKIKSFFFHSEHHHINHHCFSYFSLSISCEDVRQVFSKGMCVLNTVLIFECDIHFLSICCLAPVHHSIALY